MWGIPSGVKATSTAPCTMTVETRAQHGEQGHAQWERPEEHAAEPTAVRTG